MLKSKLNEAATRSVHLESMEAKDTEIQRLANELDLMRDTNEQLQTHIRNQTMTI